MSRETKEFEQQNKLFSIRQRKADENRKAYPITAEIVDMFRAEFGECVTVKKTTEERQAIC